MNGRFDLSENVAFVTGASSGLGAHFARTLARAGAKVAIAARRTDRLMNLAAIIEADGGRALPVELDVTEADSVARAVRIVEQQLGAVKILINNAGVPPTALTLDMDEEEWDRVIDTNLKGAWLVAREVGRNMIEHGHGGRIINVASVLGWKTVAKRTQSYGISKAGLVSMTETLALELARDGVLVNAIAPGYIRTELNDSFLDSEPGQRIRKRVPVKRFGDPEDLDGVLLLLAGPAGAYMTGSIIGVDGGLTLSAL
ncbi:MAG: 2-deoxy-D-gluconate 3-dehydrogenase [Alphaproteobacteria bacterium]|nr:2-deoxy-D-gluconate 3-dehydrogenase [Alphaproteobacteria bacterium]HCP01352.1 2-deoxy-D-gluconate 3-dehydrogenase [Rhodospirillaceae bacterium]